MIKSITVWGDSILGGIVPEPDGEKYMRLNDKCCVAAVEKQLGIPITNYARFGMTSEKGLMVMEKTIDKIPSDSAALIEFGGNDVDYPWSCIADRPENKHDPNVVPERFVKNIKSMVKLLTSRGVVPLLATLPPILSKQYFDKFSEHIPNSENILIWLGDIENIYRSHAFYNELIKKAAASLSCRLIDIRSAFTKQKDYTQFISRDGIHPNEQGHELMTAVYLDYAQKNLPSLNVV